MFNYNPYYMNSQFQNYQQRQPQMEQQFQQYNNNINNMQQPQQAYRQVVGLQGKTVDSIDVVKAMDIPLDGSVSYFPLSDGTGIVTKQLKQDGTSETILYKPVENNKKEDKKENYVTVEQLKTELKNIDSKDIKDLKDEIKNIKRQIRDLTDEIQEKKED